MNLRTLRMIELEAERLAEYGGERVALAASDSIGRVRGEIAALLPLFEAGGATASAMRRMLRELDAIGDRYYVASDLAGALAHTAKLRGGRS
jgi:hypothetical protein